MSFPVVIQGSEIMFNPSQAKPNGIPTFTPITRWVTEYGIVIPYDYYSGNIVNYLTQNKFDYNNFDYIRGMLLDVHGSLNEIHVSPEGVVRYISVPIDAYSKTVRSISTEMEEVVTALLSLGYSNAEILEYIKKNTRIHTSSVIIIDIFDLHESFLKICKDSKKFYIKDFIIKQPKD